MSFVQFWIGFTIVGLAATILLLHWAFEKRQFKESDRAGYIPLADVNDEVPVTRASREMAVLIGIFGLGIVAMIVSVVLSIMYTG